MHNLRHEYRTHQRLKGLSPRTIEKTGKAIADFLDYAGTDLDAIGPADVEAFLSTRRLSPRSRYWWLSCLHTFYKWAIRNGHATVDPTERIDRPKLRKTLPRPIATVDLAFALASAPPLERAILSLMAFEGLRAQEVAGLYRHDVAETLPIPVLFAMQGKGDKPRAVPLHPDSAAALSALPMPRSGRIFDARPWKISHTVNRFLHGLGITATGHQLRHWYGTSTYHLCRDLLMVQRLMGHSSPTTTAAYIELDMTESGPVVARLTVKV